MITGGFKMGSEMHSSYSIKYQLCSILSGLCAIWYHNMIDVIISWYFHFDKNPICYSEVPDRIYVFPINLYFVYSVEYVSGQINCHRNDKIVYGGCSVK